MNNKARTPVRIRPFRSHVVLCQREYARMRFLPFWLGIMFVLCLTAFVRPGTAEKCTSEKCHPKIAVEKFLHGPVAAKACTVCHVPGPNHRPPKKHDLTLAKPGADLCFDCHEDFDKIMTKRHVHEPVKERGCVDCHDPHQSNNKFMLAADNATSLCFNCHENVAATQAYVHKPVADGDCIVCHNPHAADNDYLLESNPLSLCFSCHEDRKADFERKYVHDPVKESCEYCHDPHASQYPYHLVDKTNDLCAQCHEDFVDTFRHSKSQHTAVIKEGCSACHSPHSSDIPKGLRTSKKDLCLKCHDKLRKKIAESRFLHGPVKEGDCIACHNPHATNNAKHLVKYFPAEFYFPYKISNYAICFQCHNNEVATEEFTDELTNFRNGKQNLHFLHVNREKGRSCKACHEVHASNQPKHIATEVPYGKSNWMLPIKFTITETGGTCQVGCHKDKAYDRVNPVIYEK